MFKPVRNFLQNTVRRRGSALLIVLGFLSFMVISGVSFAIYMRIEHQAAANYRHNVTARHLLNAGLARAMEEIDAELRVRRDYKVRWNGDPASSEPVQVKFPQWKDWPGRVKVSAVPEINNNNEDARVLSLEALSYLPAVLVNDVRRFARRQEGSNKDPEYMGAKWRQLERSIDGDLIGRYAYVCVNVSDMFDLNRMRAAQPLDSSTNRVSIGHSFLSQAEREKYDEYAAMDRMYLSMQDFYTARYDHDRSYKSSPYHEYLDTGAPGLAWFGKTPTDKQTFISDTLVKAEPVRKDAFALNAEDDPNLTRIFSNPNFMSTKDVGTLQNIADLTNPFWEALSRVPAEGRMDPAHDKRKIMALMIKDYLDKDNIPSVLTVPTTEMVPMVSQIVIEQDKWAPQIVQKSETGGSPARTVNTLYLQLFGPRTTSPAPANYPAGIQMIAPIYVELAFPFKYAQHRQYKPKFELEVEAYLYIAEDGNPKDSSSFMMTMPTPAQGYYKLKQGVTKVEDPWAKQIVTEDDAFLDCNAVLEPDGWDGAVKIVETYSDGSPPSWQAPFTAGQQFTVSLIVFARVKCGNDYVDSAPQFAPAPRALGMSAENEFMMSPKLFFQSLPMTANDGMTAGPFNYEWTSIEVADSRFNHNASNWVRPDKVPDSTDQTPNKHIGVNRSTRNILGKDGRDNDIFMSVADTGYFQSPGELGFIVRSYSTLGVPSTAPWNLREATEGDEEKHMFRTFRLYDHSTGSTENNKRDFIYNNFTTAQPDSFLTGARINPLSDFDHVLESAIWNTPLDYYLAS